MDAALGWRVVGAAALLVGALLAYLLAPSSSVIAGTGLLIDRANARGLSRPYPPVRALRQLS